jgi:hypothetical protein
MYDNWEPDFRWMNVTNIIASSSCLGQTVEYAPQLKDITVSESSLFTGSAIDVRAQHPAHLVYFTQQIVGGGGVAGDARKQ